jgi:hypothetical protein
MVAKYRLRPDPMVPFKFADTAAAVTKASETFGEMKRNEQSFSQALVVVRLRHYENGR